MTEFMATSAYAGVTISLVSYGLGAWLKKKFGFGFFNPLLISIIFTIIFFNSDLTNSCNLSNLLLNCFNIVGHSIYFARKLFKK